jgi:hypothetical protein
VLIGDSVAGETAILERMLAALDVGYTAIALRDPSTGRWYAIA